MKKCCGLYLKGGALPATPEQLMRSRYTAYSLAKIGYIARTMRGKALSEFNVQDAKRWALRVKWKGLHVVNTFLESDNKGVVEFIAQFQEGETLQRIHEISVFERIEGQWFYMEGSHRAE